MSHGDIKEQKFINAEEKRNGNQNGQTRTSGIHAVGTINFKGLFLHLFDEIISEPLGGAHRDKDMILDNVRNSIRKNLDFFISMDKEEILLQRKNKFLSIGRNQGFTTSSKISDNLSMKTNIIDKFINKFIYNKKYLIYFILLLFIIILFASS